MAPGKSGLHVCGEGASQPEGKIGLPRANPRGRLMLCLTLGPPQMLHSPLWQCMMGHTQPGGSGVPEELERQVGFHSSTQAEA